ncbi:prevent-host-death protein [Leptospira wolffii]|uniref:Prevent-host-death protein n=1 Tax=Leptospira wolffii TaxID=409998 RepID=A0A2M9ZA86_9LEPT|nr:type II toxin-antitoxin system prevent-host-death family antitoxin [Leptospira wolffii]PJZ65361.1 prevent-host-death protein [Leptospira wolffii]
MKKKVNLGEAKAHLGKYLKAASAGERIILAERNRPIAELKILPEAVRSKKPKPGILRNQFTVPDDFNSSLAEFEADYYGD